jgi:hypothetical protein
MNEIGLDFLTQKTKEHQVAMAHLAAERIVGKVFGTIGAQHRFRYSLWMTIEALILRSESKVDLLRNSGEGVPLDSN